MSTTCQICGRAIKAAKGTIAHHGYTRPRHMHWQTASCFGTHYRPYEVACDAIPHAIRAAEAFLARAQRNLHTLVTDPPASFTYLPHPTSKATRTVERPAGFSPDDRPDYRPDSYVTRYLRARHELVQSVNQAGADIEHMRRRLADWRAP